MQIIGSIGVILGLLTVIYLSMKQLNILVAAPIASLVIIVLNQMPLFDTLFGTEGSQYMGALANYVMNFFMVFLLGALLARVMDESGATVSIANYILEIVGADNPYRVLVAIFIISAVLTYGGISLFVVMFAVIPLARTLFRKLDLAWPLIQLPIWLGIATITMTMLPGTPAIQNVIPINYLDTSLTAAFIPSILGAIGATDFGLFYMKVRLNQTIASGDTYANYETEHDLPLDEDNTNLPSVGVAVTPLITLIVLAFAGSLSGIEFLEKNVIYIALIVGVVLAFILFRPYIDNPIQSLSQGAVNSMAPIMGTAAAVAFGAVVMSAPGFEVFQSLILGIPGSPYISLSFLTSILSLITGSTSGALGIVMPNYAEYYLSTGLHPEMIHRVAAVGANILTIAPQGGALLTFLSITGLNHKNGFKDSFLIVTGASLVAIVIIIISGSFIYG